MHGTVSTVSNQRQLSGIRTVASENLPRCSGHIRIDDSFDPPSGSDQINVKRLGDLAANGLSRSLEVEVHATIGKTGGS